MTLSSPQVTSGGRSSSGTSRVENWCAASSPTPTPYESLAFTPDGHLLAARGSFTVDLWDVAAGAVAHSLKGAAALISFASMAMSPDGKKIVTGDTDGSIRVWDVAEGKQLQELEAHVTPVDTVAFSPDGTSYCLRQAATRR